MSGHPNEMEMLLRLKWHALSSRDSYCDAEMLPGEGIRRLGDFGSANAGGSP